MQKFYDWVDIQGCGMSDWLHMFEQIEDFLSTLNHIGKHMLDYSR